jgi:hypothetical protein
LTVFWDLQGTLLHYFLNHGSAVNADCYCETTQCLMGAIWRKHHD